jgi:hypothetical protein
VAIETQLLKHYIYSSLKVFDHEGDFEVPYYANVAGLRHKIKICISKLVHIRVGNMHEATSAYLSPSLW